MYYLFLDCETGGLPENTSLLELGMIITDSSFNVIEEVCYKVKPDDGIYSITAQALSVNRIDLVSHDLVANKYKDVKTPLSTFLNHYWSFNDYKPLIPVGKNISFDTRRIFGTLISKAHWETMVSYQPMELNGIWRYLELVGKVPALPKTSLSDIAEYLKIPVLDLHSSLGDCRLYIEVMKELVKL